MTKTTWRVDYQNDTGPNDGGFYEWFEVTDGARTFRCDSEGAAYYLCDLLNETDNDQDAGLGFRGWG